MKSLINKKSLDIEIQASNKDSDWSGQPTLVLATL